MLRDKIVKILRLRYKFCLLCDIDGVFNSLGRIEEEKELIQHDWGICQITKENIQFLEDRNNIHNIINNIKEKNYD